MCGFYDIMDSALSSLSVPWEKYRPERLVKRNKTKEKKTERKRNIADYRKNPVINNMAGFPTESPVTRESSDQSGESLHFLQRQSRVVAR